MQKVIEWIKSNPWRAAVIVLVLACVVLGGVGYGCGYIRGCQAAKAEAVK